MATRLTLWALTTCMGRLAHLEQTAPRILADPEIDRWLLVDWSCPNGAGAWVRAHCDPERASVLDCPGHAFFHKTAALNRGLHHAQEHGAELLIHLDADTLIEPGFGAAVRAALAEPRDFAIAREKRDLLGLLGARVDLLAEAGGWDEIFHGWGHEDLELRVRLALRNAARAVLLPKGCATPIAHGFELRGAHQPNTVKHSHDLNRAILHARLASWGYDPARLPAPARALLRWR